MQIDDLDWKDTTSECWKVACIAGGLEIHYRTEVVSGRSSFEPGSYVFLHVGNHWKYDRMTDNKLIAQCWLLDYLQGKHNETR